MPDNGATSWENLFMPYVNNKGADQPAHLQAMEHRHTNIILPLFNIPFVLKCAAKILKIGLRIRI